MNSGMDGLRRNSPRNNLSVELMWGTYIVKYSSKAQETIIMNKKDIVPIIVLFLLLVLCAGCREQKALSVSEIIQNAEALNGRVVRVRGVAYLWVNPTQAEMWMFGGCAPSNDASSSSQGNVVGWLTLYDQIDPNGLKNYGVPHDKTGIRISDSDFHCNGNYCSMTCSSFEVQSQQAYEFVGTLRFNKEAEPILENLNLGASRLLLDGKWVSIPMGESKIFFP